MTIETNRELHPPEPVPGQKMYRMHTYCPEQDMTPKLETGILVGFLPWVGDNVWQEIDKGEKCSIHFPENETWMRYETFPEEVYWHTTELAAREERQARYEARWERLHRDVEEALAEMSVVGVRSQDNRFRIEELKREGSYP